MSTIVKQLGLKSNPFEHYTAETEPHIAEYAVRPPYLQAIIARALAHTTFILFGDRGAGKSATRITLFNEIWARKGDDRRPLVVNFVDFTSALPSLRKGAVSEDELVKEVAYLVIEQILTWLASLPEQDRAEYTEALDADETSLVIALIKAFYLSRPEMDRQRTMSDALRLLNQAWKTKSIIWIIVEHDIQYAGAENHPLLSQQSIEDGLDKYVKERITAVYPDKTLGQIFRLSETKFVNKDVQNAFRVNAQSARTKIKNWEDAGLVKQIGTRAPEGDQGGKPSNEYAIIDARVERIITRRLIHLEDDVASEDDILVEE